MGTKEEGIAETPVNQSSVTPNMQFVISLFIPLLKKYNK